MTPSRSDSKKKKQWGDKIKAKGEYWKDGKADDIVVVVMGQTGVGKSTFVKHLLNGMATDSAETPVIGEHLRSCTKHPKAFPIPIKDREIRLVVVDTPGFDDTYIDDSLILERIAKWLASSYSEDMKLGGIIYLHDLSQVRLLNGTVKNFKTFQALCGKSALQVVSLCMVKSEGLPAEDAEARETELRSMLWQNVLDNGSRVERFENTEESAWKIVDNLLGSTRNKNGLHIRPDAFKDRPTLKIQRELVHSGKSISDTKAMKQLNEEPSKLQKLLRFPKDGSKFNGVGNYLNAKTKATRPEDHGCSSNMINDPNVTDVKAPEPNSEILIRFNILEAHNAKMQAEITELRTEMDALKNMVSGLHRKISCPFSESEISGGIMALPGGLHMNPGEKLDHGTGPSSIAHSALNTKDLGNPRFAQTMTPTISDQNVQPTRKDTASKSIEATFNLGDASVAPPAADRKVAKPTNPNAKIADLNQPARNVQNSTNGGKVVQPVIDSTPIKTGNLNAPNPNTDSGKAAHSVVNPIAPLDPKPMDSTRSHGPKQPSSR